MQIYGQNFKTNIILGTSGYPSPKVLLNCIKILKTEMVTVSVRRLNNADDNSFFKLIMDILAPLVPKSNPPKKLSVINIFTKSF